MQIIAFISDLFFVPRVDSAAAQLDLQVRYIGSAADLGQLSGNPDPDRPGEALEGSTGAMVRLIALEQPALLIFDLNTDSIPWRRWITTLKSGAATRRIPILAFGSHMNVETMTAAREAGADQVLARSRFTAELPALIRKHLRIQDTAALETACSEPLSEKALEGINLFNKGEFFEAHELLEIAWNEDTSPARELYRAVLQVGVAYLQIERGNYRGAVKMFLRVRQWLNPLPESCRGVDVAQLRAAAYAAETELLRLGENGIADFPRTLFRAVRYLS